LLLLDNLDDLFDPSAAAGPDGPGGLLKDCLTASPGLRLLATCRHPLGLGSDEEPFEVDPLRDEEAIRLFLESVPDRDVRSELASLGLELLKVTLGPILDATGRMPLDLVLAAHRLTRHGESLPTLMERSARELLDLLEDPSLKHLLPRHRSRRASLELSYRRLSVRARRLFARLSFFPGGAYRPLTPLDGLLGQGWREAAEQASHLGLLRYDRERQRYSMLNPVREYAREKLDGDEGDRFRRRAARLWAEFAGRFGGALSQSASGADAEADANARGGALAALAAEEGNLLAAADWDLAQGRGRLAQAIAGGLGEYLGLRARWHVAAALHARVAEAARARRDALGAAGFAVNAANALDELGRRQEARTLLEGAVGSFRRLASRRPEAYGAHLASSLDNLGNLLAALGDPQAARATLQEAVDLYRSLAQRLPDRFLPDLAGSLNNLGNRLADLGDPQSARATLQEAVNIYRQFFARLPDAFRRRLIVTLLNLARFCAALADETAAQAALAEAWELGWRPAAAQSDEAGGTPALPAEAARGAKA